ncbi:MAG: hypothetical protein K2Y51_06030 [Gammaproteobacteria bacterium]|nr:hypothetical protein [Gammaproteobacteria bacterium]
MPTTLSPSLAPSAGRRARPHAVLLAACTVLFGLRVFAQAVQYVQPSPYLPPFEAFQGSALPYALLLPAQVLILSVMIRATVSVAQARQGPRPARGRLLARLGALYLAAALLRIALGLALPELGAWFRAWIPAVLHVVLAAFVLLLADRHLRSA